jgi:hypothetical protein
MDQVTCHSQSSLPVVVQGDVIYQYCFILMDYSWCVCICANSPKNKHICNSDMWFISNLLRKYTLVHTRHRINRCVLGYGKCLKICRLTWASVLVMWTQISVHSGHILKLYSFMWEIQQPPPPYVPDEPQQPARSCAMSLNLLSWTHLLDQNIYN